MEERKHLLKKLEVEYNKKGYKALSANSVEKQGEMTRAHRTAEGYIV